MIRILDGVAYESKLSSRCKLRAHDLGNGHLELSAQRERDWQELDWSADVIADHLAMMEKYRVDCAAEIEERSLKMAAARAKSRVRRLCKVMGADTLLTLTYRANITDLSLCKRHLKEYVRRVRRVIPDFRAVAAFERQDRGAWHVHMATERFPAHLQRGFVKVKSFNLLRAIWRSVTGEAGGNVDVSSGKRSQNRSAARIAAYISKYITKAFEEGDKWSNRWTKFGDCDVPKCVDLGCFGSLQAAISGAYDLIDSAASVVNQTVGRWADFFFVVVENNHIKNQGG